MANFEVFLYSIEGKPIFSERVDLCNALNYIYYMYSNLNIWFIKFEYPILNCLIEKIFTNDDDVML